jgi:hypothetical protein
MRVLLLLSVLFQVACFKGDGAHEVESTPRHDAARAREAGRWAGTYAFEECGTASHCWKYVFVVTPDGKARVTAEGDEQPLAVKARPRVENDVLRIAFVEYEEGPDVSKVGLHTLDPLRGRFMPGDTLATISRDTSGRPCVAFEKLESKLKTKTLCAAPSP